MKISVIGTGYVGITTACLADFGHEIVLIGREKNKIDKINQGNSPIYEPGLDEILKRNIERGKLKASTNYEEIVDSQVVFICVGTPSRKDGSIDLSQIETCSKSIAEVLKKYNDYKVIVVKSTVVPGTTKKIVKKILEEASGKESGKDFGICMNPEFLREGTGVNDFLYPDKIVIGIEDEKSEKIILGLYECLGKEIPRVITDTVTAEMIKYAQNSMLAARVSFINEIANICEKVGADVYEVAYAIGLDSRIGPKFLNAGAGFGGSCFPKDVKALISTAKSVGIDPKLLNSIIEINETQPHRIIELTKSALGDLRGKTISVLGLSFKPDTDDMRESRAVPVVKKLIEEGARVKAYDPKAIENAMEIFRDYPVEFSKSIEECLAESHACVIMTEWDEFRNIDLSLLKSPVIDGRRALDPNKVRELGLDYKSIGWKGNFPAVQ